MSTNACFLCLKKPRASYGGFESVGEFKMPASRKPVWMVLRHLGRCSKLELMIDTRTETICPNCLEKLISYDNLMVKLLDSQNALTKKLQAALDKKSQAIEEQPVMKEEDEVECGFEVLNDAPSEEEPNAGFTSFDSSDDDNIIEEFIAFEDEPSKKKKRNNMDCEVCGALFTSKEDCERHNLKEHNIKSYVCRICETACRSEEYLELHMNIHNGKLETECRYCPKFYSRKSNALRHMRKHWDKKSYQCHKCGERFSLDNMLYNHLLCHKAEENPIICEICNLAFKNSKTFKHHMTIHQEDRPYYTCHVCEKSFTQRYTLKNHMLVHKPASPGRVVDCQQTLSLPLKKGSEIRCLVCSMLCVDMDEVKKHMEMIHNVVMGEK